MRTTLIGAAGLSLALLAGLPALSQSDPEGGDRAVRAAAGQEVQLGVYANVNEACSGLPAPELRILAPPSRGTLTVRLVALSLNDASKVCSGRKLPALGVFYRAGPQSDVTDTVRIEAVADSSAKAQSFAITITKHME